MCARSIYGANNHHWDKETYLSQQAQLDAVLEHLISLGVPASRNVHPALPVDVRHFLAFRDWGNRWCKFEFVRTRLAAVDQRPDLGLGIRV